MGNCCIKPSAMEWGGEDWGSMRTRTSKVFDEGEAWKEVEPEKKKLLGEKVREYSFDDHNDIDNKGKVTIRITKKELKELMGSLGKKIEERNTGSRREDSSSAEQVLIRLLSTRDHHNHSHHKPWRPVLQSIPELD